MDNRKKEIKKFGLKVVQSVEETERKKGYRIEYGKKSIWKVDGEKYIMYKLVSV
jgi:hypothetical protein